MDTQTAISARAKLSAWLRDRNIKAGAFGALVPMSKDRISLILTGRRQPRLHECERFEQITAGFVKVGDWQ